MVNKRGISAIVATVLIILITVAAVTIIWSVIIPMIKDNMDTADYKTRLSIGTSGGYTFYDEDADKLYVQVVRGSDDGDIVGMEIIVSTGGDSVTYSYNSTYVPQPNQAVMIIIGGITEMPDSVKVVPLVNVGGTIKVLGSSPTKIISSGTERVPGDPTPRTGGPAPAPTIDDKCVVNNEFNVGGTVDAEWNDGYTGSWAWDNPNYALVDDSNYASTTFPDETDDDTSDLYVSNFGFDSGANEVPVGATILGIEVEIKTEDFNINDIDDEYVQLVDGSAVHVGNAENEAVYSWEGNPMTYGGSSDMWGTSLTATDLRDSNFGVTIRAIATDPQAGGVVGVYYIKVKVYYETPCDA